jgi:adenosylmethionine-8-amino-7-oxononanoate aminotransferase
VTGSEAVESAVKIAMQYHGFEKGTPESGRNVFIARKRSYHGATMGALGVSGHTARRSQFEDLLPRGTRFISPCYPYREQHGRSEAQYVEALKNELDAEIRAIGPEKVAGFFAEPVVGAVCVAP